MTKNQTVLASFGQLNRDDNFKIITKIIKDDSQIFVRKEAYTKKATPHIDKLLISHNKLNKALSNFDNIRLVNVLRSGYNFVDFEYVIGCNAEYKSFNSIISGDYSEAIETIDRILSLIDSLQSNREKNETTTVKKINDIYRSSSSVKYINPGIVDLNLDNFIINKKNELVTFDYEWVFDQPVAADFAKTRLLYSFFARRSEAFAFLPKDNKIFKAIIANGAQTLIPAELYIKYSQYLSKESMKKYWEAEDIFQKSVNKYHQDTASSNCTSFIIKEISSPQPTFPDIEEANINSYNDYIRDLEKRIKKLGDELEAVESTISYRFHKKLRSIKKTITKKNF